MDVMGQFINSSFQRLCRRRRGERRWAFTKKGLPFSATHFYNISQTLQLTSHKRKSCTWISERTLQPVQRTFLIQNAGSN